MPTLMNVYAWSSRFVLKRAGVNKTALETLVADVEENIGDESDYGPDVWADLQDTLQSANDVLENEEAIQADVNAARDNLQTAWDIANRPDPVACAFTFSGDVSEIRNRDPLLVSGQSVTADISEGKTAEQFASTLQETPFVINWDSTEIRWFEGQNLVFGPRSVDKDSTPYVQVVDPNTLTPFGVALMVEEVNYTVNPALINNEQPQTSLVATASSVVSIGVRGNGDVYVNVDGTVEKMDTSERVGDFLILSTVYTNGDAPAAEASYVTFVGDFINPYPSVPGVTKHSDLCGNEIYN